MKVIQLKCPNCHADLETEDTLEICYCKYCGTKIFIGEQSDATIKARTDLQMKRDDNALERFRLEKELEEKRLEEEGSRKAMKAGIIIIVILLLFLYIVCKTI